jgi:hypothetical protein
MGTTKQVAPAPSAAGPGPQKKQPTLGMLAGMVLVQFKALEVALLTKVKDLGTAAEKVREEPNAPAAVMEQDLQKAICLYHNMQEGAKKSWEAVQELAKGFRKAGGTFELGKYSPFFKAGSSRSVKWKEEALKLARELAELKKEAFSETDFEAKIQEGYPLKPTEGFVIVEAADG